MLPEVLKGFELIESDKFLWLRILQEGHDLADFIEDFENIFNFGNSNDFNYILMERFGPRILSTIDMYTLINSVKEHLDTLENYFPMFAVVNFDNNPDDLDEFMENVAQNSGLRLKFCKDVKAAKEWFSIDE